MRQRGKVRERIIRVVLNKPDGALTKYKVAREAGCGFPWVHEFLSKLEALGLIKGTKVTDYVGLVTYWLEVRIKPDKREYMHKSPLDLLKRTRLPYALTTYQAENMVQHYLFPSRTDLYIRAEDTQQWHENLERDDLVGKGNVRLLISDDHVFYGSFEQQGLKIVSLPQLIVDLLDEGGVYVEAAEKLLEKVA